MQNACCLTLRSSLGLESLHGLSLRTGLPGELLNFSKVEWGRLGYEDGGDDGSEGSLDQDQGVHGHKTADSVDVRDRGETVQQESFSYSKQN